MPQRPDVPALSRVARLACAASCLVLAACSDSGPSRSGTVSFMYSGTVATGNFSAAGPMPALDNLLTQSSAFAAVSGSGSTQHILLYAIHVGSDSSYQHLTIDITRSTAGSAAFSATSCSGCALFSYVPNGSLKGDAAPFIQCTLTSGSAIIDALGSRMSGTFSGSGTCTSGGLATPFSVTNGTFDVQIETRPTTA